MLAGTLGASLEANVSRKYSLVGSTKCQNVKLQYLD